MRPLTDGEPMVAGFRKLSFLLGSSDSLEAAVKSLDVMPSTTKIQSIVSS